MFGYDENKQAYIKDINAGTYRQLVEAAESLPGRDHPSRQAEESERARPGGTAGACEAVSLS